MRYINFHTNKPEENRLIYWMGPNMKDVLGWFRGNCQFHEVERKYPGYVPKWWYYAEEELSIQYPDPMVAIISEPKKRGRKPKEDLVIVQENPITEPNPVPVKDTMVQVIVEDDGSEEFF